MTSLLWGSWDPFKDMDQVLSRPGRSLSENTPLMNVYFNDEDTVVTTEMPGVNLDDIDISVSGDTLTIKGSREKADLKKDEKWHRRERGFGSFSRVVHMPYPVDNDKVEASYEKGVLKVVLPRSEADKPRKIEVRNA